MTKPTLRLGPLPGASSIKLTVVLPAAVKSELDRYAEVFAATYGKSVQPAELIPYMLSTFMARDRGFRQAVGRLSPKDGELRAVGDSDRPAATTCPKIW